MTLTDDPTTCIFCRIVRREAPAALIYEDDNVLAFLDVAPITKGHTLVIPKRHSLDLTSTDEKNLKAVITSLRTVARAIQTATDVEGFNVLQNNGEVAGQVVGHLHFHIIPRSRDDRFMSKQMPRAALKMEEGKRLAEFIRRHIEEEETRPTVRTAKL